MNMIYTIIKLGFQPSVLYDTFLPKAYAIGLKYNGLSVLQKQTFIMCSEAERWEQCRVYHQYQRGKASYYFSPMCSEAERWKQGQVQYQHQRGKAPHYFSPMCSEAEHWGQCRVRNSGGLKA